MLYAIILFCISIVPLKAQSPLFDVPNRSDKVLWQVAEDPDFVNIAQGCEQILKKPEKIEIPAACHLESGKVYFFRQKWLAEGIWSEWSDAIPFTMQAAERRLNGKNIQSTPYVKSAGVPDHVWERVLPFLLPHDHPAKIILDDICKKIRVTAGQDTMTQAGFKLFDRPRRRMMVATHPQLGGYLIKTYLDCHNLYGQDYSIWKHRCEGARQIQESIDKHQYNHLMKTPRKWLYPLPDDPRPSTKQGFHPQNFMLIVEDMKIYNKEKNEMKFKHLMNKEMLEALFTILTENRLIDSIHLANIPYCHDGRIAFIDTEHFNTSRRRIRYEKLTPYLSTEMQKHWKWLIKKKGKKELS